MPGLSRNRIAILTFHRVLADPDPLRPLQTHVSQFKSQISVLKRGFNVLPLREARARQQSGSLPPRTVVITFDDGYADNLHIALPVLKQFGLPATFFVATGFLNGGRMWNDTIIEAIRRTRQDSVDLDCFDLESASLDSEAERRVAIARIIGQAKRFPGRERSARIGRLVEALRVRELPDDLMMTDDELRRIHAQGMEVGGHTVNHPILDQVPLDQARVEIAQGRQTLEMLLDTEVRSFAYPHGRPGQDYQTAHRVAVGEAGFDLAVSTAWGAAQQSDDSLQLPRVGFSEARPLWLFLRLMRCYWDPKASRVRRNAS